jgi:exosortase
MRHVLFIFAAFAAAAMVFEPLTGLLKSPINQDYHSLIPFIPFVSGYLLYLKKEAIYSEKSYSFCTGTVVIIIGIVLYMVGHTLEISLDQNDYASIIALSSVILINGAFILSYGTQTFKAAIFPLLFLIFIIPIPSSLMDCIIHFLQVGSTEVTNLLFIASGVPFLRDGFVFHTPSMSIEVAKQCSGIRSSLALLITSLLAGHLFLRTWWKKIILVIFVVPIALFKNGIRIVTLTLLGTYVDPRILQSSLHREGGIPFFILALLFMAPVLLFLRQSDVRATKGRENIIDSSSNRELQDR